MAITGLGAHAHSGLNALQVTMTRRAGKLRVRESHMIDRAGAPIGTCRVLSISDNVFGVERLAQRAGPPLREAAAGAAPNARSR